MANQEHAALLLEQGVEAWNSWRKENVTATPDLIEAYLRKANLGGADLSGADFRAANLIKADLSGANLDQADLQSANLFNANLRGANLTGAKLAGADLSHADLFNANLRGAGLVGANLSGANFSGANLSEAALYETLFVNTRLLKVLGLDACVHDGPSVLDHRTLALSGQLPLPFLRGCGLPEKFIDYLPSLLDQPIQFYSCFISYSNKDQNVGGGQRGLEKG